MIGAFQNVADTLQALQADARAFKAAADNQRAAAQALTVARLQWRMGQTGRLSVIAAEQAFQQARMGASQAEANRLTDTAALVQAVGGGWWNRRA